MKKENKWYFGNAQFETLIKKGAVCSLKKTNDVYATEYAEENRGFGSVHLCYSECENDGSESELKEFCPNEAEAYEEAAPCVNGDYLEYNGKAADDSVEVSVCWSMKKDVLHQKVTIKNISTKRLHLKDLGILHSCHTDFKWGESAAPNVIGHHYVGGHGSHSTYYRVDGEGSCLVFAPTDGTQLAYYDCSRSVNTGTSALVGNEATKEKGYTMLYPYAEVRAARATSKGANVRTTQNSVWLEPGESDTVSFMYFWADHFLKAGEAFVDHELVNAICVPGYTLPVGWEAKLCLESKWDNVALQADPEVVEINSISSEAADKSMFTLKFKKLGEHIVTVTYGKGRYLHLYYFVTEEISTLWKKRAAFIADKQVKDENLWYNGLLCEWNNETGVLLGPDNYDRIGGWRIYEVTCDDPGLAKPAFLSTKQTIMPNQNEVTALDDYIEHFVWGGLQRTDAEDYTFGIYGIPDWKQLRDSKDEGVRGKLHIWRIYDYPHIALMYYNMYRVARDYPQMKTRLTKEEYLRRAYGTAHAMFTIPSEIEDWSAYKTGLYNECVIPRIIEALKECGMKFEADRLSTHWMRKVRFFVTECKDVFGSEYPFDTTGFESTWRFAVDGLNAASHVKDDSPFNSDIPYAKAIAFMEKQHLCNIACRGYLEPVYFGYGSDYRGNNTHYLLSYMSQMGGCSILEHALYYENDPFEMLRLGYGSLLSSYALMNTGTEESNYGYWFPGKEHDGAAGGGFEPLYEGETWLNQPHHGGSWYYSCEIDLGFCGGVRGDCVVLAKDPLFGNIVYGGTLEETDKAWKVSGADGSGRKFHFVEKDRRFHAVLDRGRFDAACTAEVAKDGSKVTLFFDEAACDNERSIAISISGMGKLLYNGTEYGTKANVVLAAGQKEAVFEMVI